MKRYLVVITVLLFACYTNGQNFKFGKVSHEELKEENYHNDKTIHAAVLYRSQRLFFEYEGGRGFIQKNEVYERIKIYSKEGFDYANQEIKLYDSGDGKVEKVVSLKGCTYNLEGNKIEETKLKKEGVFKEVTNKYWKTRKFTMPNVKEGSVIEYKYVIESPFLQVDDIPFQALIPIKKLDFKFSSPEYFGYKILTNLQSEYTPKFKRDRISKSMWVSSERKTYLNQTVTAKGNINYMENIIYASVANIPPLRNERYVDNIYNYQAKLVLELEYTKYPNQPVNMLVSDWGKVTKTIYDHSEFGEQLNKTSYFKKDLDVVLKEANTFDEKLSRIFNFIKNKIKWNNIGGYYTDLGVGNAYQKNTGNSADINLALIAMMRYAGLNANPVLISTKSNGISLFPTRTGFNYVICAIEVNGKTILLDATSQFTTGNIIPIKALNWQGRLIRKDGSSEWVNLMPSYHSEKRQLINFNINSDLRVSGKSQCTYKDYSAFRFRERYSNQSQGNLIKTLEQDNVGLKVQTPELKYIEELDKPVNLSYEFEHDSCVEEVGDKLYFSPLLFLAEHENEFKEDKRSYPIDFSFMFSEKIIANINIPQGYIIETLPKQAKFVCGDAAEYSFVIQKNKSNIQLITNFKLNKSVINPEEYPDFKTFYQMYIDKQLEKIVLKKE